MTPTKAILSRLALTAALIGAGLTASLPGYAQTAGGHIILAQAQDQDRDQTRDQDRLRDWTDADRDQIRDRLRDGSCQDVVQATDEVLEALGPCMDQQRLRDGSCMAQIDLGVEALQRTRELCSGN